MNETCKNGKITKESNFETVLISVSPFNNQTVWITGHNSITWPIWMFYEILSTKITFQFNLHFIFLLLGLQGVPYYLKIPLCVLWHLLISKRILQETGDWDISLSNVFKPESINKVNKFWLWISCRTVVQNNLSVAKLLAETSGKSHGSYTAP